MEKTKSDYLREVYDAIEQGKRALANRIREEGSNPEIDSTYCQLQWGQACLRRLGYVKKQK